MKKWLNEKIKYCWEYTVSYLDTRFKQIGYFSAVGVAILLAAYICAVFDVGIKKWDISIGAMFKAYWGPRYAFPWGVWLILTIIILYFAVFIIWKHGTPPGSRNFNYSKSTVYGSSKEMTQRELAKVTDITHKDSTLNMILGQLDTEGKQVIAQKPGIMPNENKVVFGPPGCGKSTSFVLPFIMQTIMRRESLVVTDTKGEVYAKTAEAARYNGYQVLRLDFKNPEYSDGWHVLKELRHEFNRALVFADTVAANSGNLSDTFIEAQKGLLTAVCLYQERMPGIPDTQRTFYQAMAMILQGPAKLDQIMEAALSAYPEEMLVVGDTYSTFKNGSPNLRDNIVNGLASRLRILSSPDVRNMTSVDEIDFVSIGKQPTILYLSMSDQNDTMKFLASLAFSFAMMDLIDYADSRKEQHLDIPVHFLMEEFGNLGRVPSIDRYLSTARSRGISINLVVQSLGQLHGIYEENMTNTILADCSIWMALGCNDKMTAELLEWRSGQATVKVKTEQHDAVESALKVAYQHSTGDGKRYVYTSNEIMDIKTKKEVMIIWQERDTMITNAFPIFLHREFIDGHMPMIPSNGLIPLTNRKAKAKFRQWENQRIASFNTWMEAGGNPLRDYQGFAPKKRNRISKSDRPDIEPVHVLQNKALAWSHNEKYDPQKDPYNPLYVAPDGTVGMDQNLLGESDFFEFTEDDFIFVAEEESDSAEDPVPAAEETQISVQQEQAEPTQDPKPENITIQAAAISKENENEMSIDSSVNTDIPSTEAGEDSTEPIYLPRENSAQLNAEIPLKDQPEPMPAKQVQSDTPENNSSSSAHGSATTQNSELQNDNIDDLMGGSKNPSTQQKKSGSKPRRRTEKPVPKTAFEDKSTHRKLDDALQDNPPT